MTRLEMFKEYTSRAGAHKYINGFILKGRIFACVCDESTTFEAVKLDKASRGAGLSIRFKPNTSDKYDMLSNAETVIEIASAKFFKEEHAQSKYNRGEVFEKMVTEYFGQEWVKDNIEFTKCGDINVNGVEYQIKFEGATFTTEKQIARLRGQK